MPYSLSILELEDYAKWKTAFDAHCDTRKAVGEKTHQIFHIENDPNKIVLLVEWDSLDNAREFLQSAELLEAMKRAGVIGQPDVYLLEEGEKGSV